MLTIVVTHASHMRSALADLLPQQIGISAPADGGFVLKQPRTGLVRRVTWHKLPGERTQQFIPAGGTVEMYHSNHPPRDEPKPSVPSQPVAEQVWWECLRYGCWGCGQQACGEKFTSDWCATKTREAEAGLIRRPRNAHLGPPFERTW